MLFLPVECNGDKNTSTNFKAKIVFWVLTEVPDKAIDLLFEISRKEGSMNITSLPKHCCFHDLKPATSLNKKGGRSPLFLTHSSK
ncbi:MAG: hypothetical protein CL666_12355 [Balneola sp.]|nr:hypothetical protein [Balneola sp.]